MKVEKGEETVVQIMKRRTEVGRKKRTTFDGITPRKAEEKT